MPMNSKEVEAFRKDPVRWMKDQIQENLPSDPLSQAVFKLAAKYKIKHRKKEFYIILAFIALMNNELITADFQRYRMMTANPEKFEQKMPGERPKLIHSQTG